jgi:hypothetical protein
MIESIYTSALLAAAAYARWDREEPERKTELINNRGFTDAQYEALFDPDTGAYEIVGYTEDPNGFSATAFRNRSTGKVTISFRGTEPSFPFVDFLADISAVLGNTGGVLELFNQTNNIDDFLSSNNLISNGQLNQEVDFSGHSLGGYLSIIAAYKYSSSFSEVYTYNGLGLNPLENAWLEIKNSIAGLSLDSTKVHNYFADKGDEWASNDLFSRPGGQERIFIEEDTGVSGEIENHSIAKLVESLSVYRVLALLGPALDSSENLPSIYNILDSSNNLAVWSLETVVVKLGDLLGGAIKTETDKMEYDIEVVYQEIKSYLDDSDSTFSISDLSAESASSISSNAMSSVAYRYALTNLLSFAIEGNDSIYDQHNVSGQLDYAANSERYWQTRALFLDFLLERNTNDLAWNESVNEELVDQYFYDVTSGNKVTTGATYTELQDQTQRFLFGSDGVDGNADGFIGGTNNDYLFGMGGNDQLDGGEGNDHLEGGTGVDTYLYTSGDGHDTIVDSNGVNNIRFNGNPLGSFTALDGDTSIYTSDDPSSNISLVKNGTDLTINDFNASNFDFVGNNAMPTPEPGVYDVAYIKSNSSESGIWSSYSMRSVLQFYL